MKQQTPIFKISKNEKDGIHTMAYEKYSDKPLFMQNRKMESTERALENISDYCSETYDNAPYVVYNEIAGIFHDYDDKNSFTNYKIKPNWKLFADNSLWNHMVMVHTARG